MLTLHIADKSDTLIYPKPHHTPATFTILNFRWTTSTPPWTNSRSRCQSLALPGHDERDLAHSGH